MSAADGECASGGALRAEKKGTGLIVVKFMFAGSVFRCFAAYVRPRVEVEQCLSHLVYTQGEERSTMK